MFGLDAAKRRSRSKEQQQLKGWPKWRSNGYRGLREFAMVQRCFMCKILKSWGSGERFSFKACKDRRVPALVAEWPHLPCCSLIFFFALARVPFSKHQRPRQHHTLAAYHRHTFCFSVICTYKFLLMMHQTSKPTRCPGCWSLKRTPGVLRLELAATYKAYYYLQSLPPPPDLAGTFEACCP